MMTLSQDSRWAVAGLSSRAAPRRAYRGPFPEED
jgi:hypothetical protein